MYFLRVSSTREGRGTSDVQARSIECDSFRTAFT